MRRHVTARVLRGTGALALAWTVLVGVPADVAQASCAEPLPLLVALDRASSVFVGTVSDTANDDRWAIVSVHEIWKGPEVGPTVEVRGGADPGAATSVDRMYESGMTYLFVLDVVDGSLADSACSATTQWHAEFDQLRPASAHPPLGEPTQTADAGLDPAQFVVPVAAAGLVGVLLFGALIAFRRRSPEG